jgi:hypothetical protein
VYCTLHCTFTVYFLSQSILPCSKSWRLFCTFVNIGPVGHFLSKQVALSQLKTCLGSFSPSLIILFISAGNVVAASSSAVAASPKILKFLRFSLLLNLLNHLKLALKGLVSSSFPLYFESPRIGLKPFAVTRCFNVSPLSIHMFHPEM